MEIRNALLEGEGSDSLLKLRQRQWSAHMEAAQKESQWLKTLDDGASKEWWNRPGYLSDPNARQSILADEHVRD
jgi:hypothetical protein